MGKLQTVSVFKRFTVSATRSPPTPRFARSFCKHTILDAAAPHEDPSACCLRSSTTAARVNLREFSYDQTYSQSLLKRLIESSPVDAGKEEDGWRGRRGYKRLVPFLGAVGVPRVTILSENMWEGFANNWRGGSKLKKNICTTRTTAVRRFPVVLTAYNATAARYGALPLCAATDNYRLRICSTAGCPFPTDASCPALYAPHSLLLLLLLPLYTDIDYYIPRIRRDNRNRAKSTPPCLAHSP